MPSTALQDFAYDAEYLRGLLRETSNEFCPECDWTDHEADEAVLLEGEDRIAVDDWRPNGEMHHCCPWCEAEISNNDPTDNREAIMDGVWMLLAECDRRDKRITIASIAAHGGRYLSVSREDKSKPKGYTWKHSIYTTGSRELFNHHHASLLVSDLYKELDYQL